VTLYDFANNLTNLKYYLGVFFGLLLKMTIFSQHLKLSNEKLIQIEHKQKRRERKKNKIFLMQSLPDALF
jgi:hypothetical protein